ncbi:MAG: DNA-3-methyladenine glycosylase 2 family protein [Oscillospiraceae bacterium]|nr:DNA-3-methyladenine glycosylase 2 family protein [Oscillospiraceae bacterium]
MIAKELIKFSVDAGEDFDLPSIFECGQAFRWNADSDGTYWGMAYGIPASLYKEEGKVYILSEEGSFERVWKNYFDMDRDYGALREEISREEKLKKACDFGKGIRILNQEPWEALCSFIISQCNNIPRIKGIVERLCLICGEKHNFCGKEMYSFPDAKTVAQLSESEISSLRSGYRGAYIKNAAEGVASGEINLEKIKSLPTEAAKRELLKIEGVGEKVASCTLLFGMGKLDAFPVDVWMKRAIEEFFGKGKFDYKRFGNLAGLAQQYMFHYMRNRG